MIEDFETVDILEDSTEQREDRYIYRSFWAYDAVKDCWYKVDIRDHGYRLGPLSTTVGAEENPEAAAQKSPGFWKNWTLGFRVGSGPTFYENKIAHCVITERDGAFFLQTEEGVQDSKSYKINWLGAGYKQCGDPLAGSSGALGAEKSKASEQIVFKGVGWNMPIALFTHYTFLKRLRVGAGCELELNYLKELTPKGGVSHMQPFKVQPAHQWFYNLAWFGLLGFKVVHTPHHDVVVDFQLGRTYNAGVALKNMLSGKGHLYDGWLLGAGIAYERKLSSYFKLLTRLSGDWKIHNDVPQSINDPQVSIKLNQIALHLDLGIQISFGKAPKEYESTELLDADYELVQPQSKTAPQTEETTLQRKGQ